LIEKYGLIHLSTGEILRAEMAAETTLGVKARSFMDQGELVPDEDVVTMVVNRIDKETEPDGFIFDGFPRTCAQAESLREMLVARGTRISLMISLEVPEEELIKRLINRGKETGRSDDELSVIKNRIEVYNNVTAPVMDFYRQMNKFAPVDGTGSIEEIFERIVHLVDALN
jgi:adenylate kinase